MLTTSELEHHIKNIFKQVLPNVEMRFITFAHGNCNSPEGTYVFSENEQYHYLITEKGKIGLDEVILDERKVLWHVADNIIFNIALEFAAKNRQDGKDFRRKLFEKEIELFSLFGEDFRERKENEIQEILLNNPFVDEINEFQR